MAFRPSLFRRYGEVETRYRIAGDRAFLLNLALAAEPPRIASVDAVLYRYHVHGGSLTLKRGLEQRLRVARDHLALSRQLLAKRRPPRRRVGCGICGGVRRLLPACVVSPPAVRPKRLSFCAVSSLSLKRTAWRRSRRTSDRRRQAHRAGRSSAASRCRRASRHRAACAACRRACRWRSAAGP